MLIELNNILQSRSKAVEAWIDKKWKGLIPPFYLSCDIRHSGHKISVIDSNAFPAGFNNLCNSFSKETSKAFADYLKTHYPKVQKILVLAEDHTRNKFYLKNLLALQKLLQNAKQEVCLGIIGETLSEDELNLQLDDLNLTLAKIRMEGGGLKAKNFVPDLIVSNNDFSSGYPEILKNISQPIIPSPSLGWFSRKKNHHFELLNTLFRDFSACFDLDPWRLSAYSEVVKEINFSDPVSLQKLSKEVDQLTNKIKLKYQQYNISDTPYVYIKSNMGTYGMGLLPVFSGEEVLTLNRRQKNKLQSAKGGAQTSEYLIQEGIPTTDYYSDYPLEPVIYVVGKKPIGGFFRIHESKNELESLNAPGMSFSCLCLHKLDEPHEEYFLNCQEKGALVTLSFFIARIAALAIAMEQR